MRFLGKRQTHTNLCVERSCSSTLSFCSKQDDLMVGHNIVSLSWSVKGEVCVCVLGVGLHEIIMSKITQPLHTAIYLMQYNELWVPRRPNFLNILCLNMILWGSGLLADSPSQTFPSQPNDGAKRRRGVHVWLLSWQMDELQQPAPEPWSGWSVLFGCPQVETCYNCCWQPTSHCAIKASAAPVWQQAVMPCDSS